MENSKIDHKNHLSLEVTNGEIMHVNVFDAKSGRSGNYSFNHTRHSLKRSDQRGINNHVISLVIEFGKVFQKQGLEYYVLGSDDLVGLNPHIKDRAKNTVVVLGRGGLIVTCYKGNKAIKNIRRKKVYLSAA